MAGSATKLTALLTRNDGRCMCDGHIPSFSDAVNSRQSVCRASSWLSELFTISAYGQLQWQPQGSQRNQPASSSQRLLLKSFAPEGLPRNCEFRNVEIRKERVPRDQETIDKSLSEEPALFRKASVSQRQMKRSSDRLDRFLQHLARFVVITPTSQGVMQFHGKAQPFFIADRCNELLNFRFHHRLHVALGHPPSDSFQNPLGDAPIWHWR